MWFYSWSLSLVLSCVVLRVAVSTKGDFTRKVSVVHNPGCDIDKCKGNGTMNVIYGRAQGPNDTLHYIVSTTGPSSPTILLLRTDVVTATLNINWKSFSGNTSKDLTGAVKLLSKDGKTVSADVESVIIVDRVLEYNDSSDTAVYNASTEIKPYIMLKQLNWEVMTNGNTTQLLGKSDADNDSSFTRNSSISFQFTVYGSSGQADKLPSLPFNANSSGWEINLASLCGNQSGSRFAIESLLLGVEAKTSKMSAKSIDDEYAPAAFVTEKIEWLKNSATNGDVLTFLNWRAISYTSPDHSRSTVTDVKTDSIVTLNKTTDQVQSVRDNRLLAAYFGTSKLNSLNVNSVIFSFGQPEDGYYSASNYTSWTSTIGFGVPPTDQFSVLVLCMLFIGIGCPLLVIVFGGFYVGYVRIKRSGRTLKMQVMPTNYDYQPIEK